jgi:sarcosine oxidase, subunit alpha
MSRPGPYRLSGATATHPSLQREHSIRFRFDGRQLAGYAGDSLASALLANGVRTVSRSFKFHRPRGVYACGVEEPNALVQLYAQAKAIPSARATLVELHEGLETFSQSGWPNVRTDLGRVLDFAAPVWAAGFYNKTFMWPSWHAYEWLVRRMAGLGRAPVDPDPDRYETRNLHCDVLIIGAGEAGLREAYAASQTGARVVLVEQDAELGGNCAWDGRNVDGMPGRAWVDGVTKRLLAADVRVLRRTTAVGYYDRDVVTLLEDVSTGDAQRGVPRERYWIVRAGRVVVASGAIEQPLVFCNNDRPGIVMAGAARKYLRRYSVAVGRRVLIATNNDSAYAAARDLKQAGVEVVAVADTRHEISNPLAQSMRSLSIPLLLGSMPVDTSGVSALTGVSIGRLSRDSKSVQDVQRYACDALAVSGGWSPTLHLYSQAGGKLIYDERTGALKAATSLPLVSLAGAAAGESEHASEQSPGIRISPVGNTLRQWVDLRHDVTVADLELAVRENYVSVEHVKRYTTVGMSVDQGKTSNAAAIEIVAKLRGKKPSELGHTTLRPPFTPVTLGAIAGRQVGERFAPSRLLPMHDWHVANGALIEDYGEWKRPAVYLNGGESRAAGILREARTVRSAAGLFDGSALGKIEVHGPDAREFLDRFYINNLATLKPGRARYGLMLRESGVIFDDGTVVMLAPDRFVITTTSGNAGRVGTWLEEWHQCEWPQLRVAIMPVSEQWATVSLAGPRAREILSTLDTDIDLSPAAFTHLDMREGRLLGQPARIYRVSFTGELTYEINVPTDVGPIVWEALMDAGRPQGLQPLGIEALLLMRLEKGFLHVGTDTDGTTVPDDVGWGKVAAGKNADFVGKRSLYLPENRRADRLQLVGLIGEDTAGIVVGSHMRLAETTEATDGWVTSSGRAVQTGEPIALALLRGGRDRIGALVSVHHSGVITRARVVNPPFYDPSGERMNA